MSGQRKLKPSRRGLPGMTEIVSNTGPIIALAGIGQIDLLRSLFGSIFIPPVVAAEIKDEKSLNALSRAEWITVRAVSGGLAVQLLRDELDAGESEAIVLAQEVQAELLPLDERTATRKARSIGLHTIGTLGLLLLAKEQGVIHTIQPMLDALRQTGFHVSIALYHQVLDSAGESSDATPNRYTAGG